ncbi:MAG: FAD-dependent oxidoreductase [Ardenticatenaceae bacterium]|nr:FAD-dependent oxidoreductase [Ardenticatenaceae bacterium]
MKANVVIIGAGIIGASLAYHLADMGVEGIVLVDKGDLDANDGSTGHAPGGLRVLTANEWFTRLGSRSRKLYDKLPLAVEGEEQFFRTGSMQIALEKWRFESYRRLQEWGMTHGEPTFLLTPEEVQAKVPLVDASKVVGGIFLPNGGVLKTSRLATSLRKMGEATGRLTSFADTLVTEVVVSGGRVQGVLTDNPDLPRIECEQVVLCSNIWAPLLCEKLGVNMPLFPGQHQYIYTDPVPALDERKHIEVTMPVTTVDDISIYFRQHSERLGIGSYHHRAMLVDPHKLGKKAEFPFTPEDFTTAWGLMQDVMPPLKQSRVSHGFNGMFAFTVDGFPIVGESPIKGFWTSVGAWLSFAGELGKVLARWMVTGDPGMDMRMADINRFQPYQLNREYVTRQSKYYYEIGFDVIHPNQVASSVRNLKQSPQYDRVAALGAQFAPFAGTESALWYESNAPLLEKYGDKIPPREGWDAQYWSPIQGAEHLAVREGVGLVDWGGGMAAIEVSGPGATAYLNYLCTNKVDKPVGGVTYTLWLTPKGGVRRDLTVARLGEERYWVLTGKGDLPAELVWMERNYELGIRNYEWGEVMIRSLGDEKIAIALWGPKARQVLQKVATADVSNEAFPFYTVREMGVGMVPTVAVRLSYAGELGWEFYAGAGYGRLLWDTLWEAGQEFGMHPCGISAVMSLRLEKGYRLYGADITPEYNAYEAGLGWLLRYNKGDFVGREAALAQKAAGVQRKLVCLAFDDPQAIMYGNEPVLVDGEVVGRVTSGNRGYTVGKFIAMAYVAAAYAEAGTQVQVRYSGNSFDGVVVAEPLWDVGNGRLLG